MRTKIGPILQTCTGAALDVSCYSGYLTTVRNRLMCDMLVASAIMGNVAFILGTSGSDTRAAGGSSGGISFGFCVVLPVSISLLAVSNQDANNT